MISEKPDEMGRQIEKRWASSSLTLLSDAQLLRRFVEAWTQGATGEAAFRELVNRHAAMVLGVCRQNLRHRHDVDDAFQATFLVLVRKAPMIRVDDSIAPWLCSVAYRTAHRTRADIACHVSLGDELVEGPGRSSPDDSFRFELRPMLHSVAVLLFGAALGSFALWAHWPSGTANAGISRHDVDRAPQSAQPPATSQPTGADTQLATRSTGDSPATDDDDLPPYCPIAITVNVVSKMVGHFHGTAETAR